MIVATLPKRDRKRLARDVFGIFATHANLACDVIDTDCEAHKWQHLWSRFRDLQLSILNKLDQKSSENLMCVKHNIIPLVCVKLSDTGIRLTLCV